MTDPTTRRELLRMTALPVLAGLPAPAEARDVLRLDLTPPQPTLTMINRVRIGGRTVSAVARIWEPGDARRCRLCPPGQCCAVSNSGGDTCLVAVSVNVPRGGAAGLSTVGMVLQSPEGDDQW